MLDWDLTLKLSGHTHAISLLLAIDEHIIILR